METLEFEEVLREELTVEETVKENLNIDENFSTQNYEHLTNIPKINGIKLTGDKSSKDLMLDQGDTFYAYGADYAEVGIWEDLNPKNEDRLYRFVTLKSNGRNIAIANLTDQILGVTTTKAAFVGNAKDYVDTDTTKNIVGIVGVVPVKTNDSTIQVNDRVMSDDNGYAIKSSNNLGYRVLQVLNDNLIEIVVSPNTDMIQRIKTDMSNKQDTLIAGENITIKDNVISSTGKGIDESSVKDVQVDNVSVVENKIANIPLTNKFNKMVEDKKLENERISNEEILSIFRK